MFLASALVAVCSVALPVAHAAGPPDDDDEAGSVTIYEFADDFATGATMSATPGGAQDVAFFRDRVRSGEVPHPSVFTPEGLFSEHHLPAAKGRQCRALLCPTSEATDARLLAHPDVRFLGQLGFATNIDAEKFERAPLDLVAVVDRSGSMSGVLSLVRQSLLEVVDQLGPNDRISIVAYGDRAQVLLRPMPVDPSHRQRIVAAIRQLESGGSTAMEDGIRKGLQVARRNQLRGRTSRIMLFTDERPNVGVTDAHSFMGLARAGSKDGIGMTTVGVGVQFGAELATQISSVRGGNLFFFPDSSAMRAKFEAEFDTMVTELAHDMRLVVAPAAGMKVTGIYGIPGDKLKWTNNGAIEVEVETLFVSRKAGAIYFSLAPNGNPALPRAKFGPNATIATVQVEFTPVGAARRSTEVDVKRVAPRRASAGLARGLLLVDEATALREATRRHHEANDQEGAYQLVHALAGRFRRLRDSDMQDERALVLGLEQTLAVLSGHAGESG